MGGFKRGAWCAVVALSLIAGCEDVDSKNIKTNGMFADFRVTGRGDGQSEVRASLKVGGSNSNTFVELSDGDVLSATSDGETRTLTPAGAGGLNIHVYRATFTGAETGKEFTVSFEREDDESAPNSTTMLPEAFEITGPVATEEVSRAQPLVITWSPSGTSDRMGITVNGDCTIINSPIVNGDSGTFTIPANEIRAPSGREGDSCDVSVRLTRERSGTVDPAYGEGGRFNGVQERTVTYRSVP